MSIDQQCLWDSRADSGYLSVVGASSLHAFTTALAGSPDTYLQNNPYLAACGYILVINGMIAAVRQQHRFERKLRNEPEKLIDTRANAVIRHPLLAYWALASIGLVLANPSLENTVTEGLTLTAMGITTYCEEKALENRFEEKYHRYKEKVPMFIPHLDDLMRNPLGRALCYIANVVR